MKYHIKENPWHIEESEFHPEFNEVSESIFSIGNGKMGQRGNFEEAYSGKSLQGFYVGGVYYPDKTRVGWWKNGYPEYFAKVINAPSWINLDIRIDGQKLDIHLAKKVLEFYRKLDMKEGVLYRSCKLLFENNLEISLETERFVSMDESELGALSYRISSNRAAEIEIVSFLSADVHNRDSNYDEQFWIPLSQESTAVYASIEAETKKTAYRLHLTSTTEVLKNGKALSVDSHGTEVGKAYHRFVSQIDESGITIYKKAIVVSSFDHEKDALKSLATGKLDKLSNMGYESLKDKHAAVWEKLWEFSDIEINGDVAAQQGIRFNIFQLIQTYTGRDSRLNIGPKGFTGEKYGGVTYWDTEAYCLPFYLYTRGNDVARNLLIYRYNQLDKAIENAGKLGFGQGAALYPMVTMNGEECHNEWEITFEEIHRNGAIAYAIYDFTTSTGDKAYLFSEGLEVLIAISRFWSQRVHWSENKSAFVMLGVTGPNEYENNVNNNWYTNYIARWCLDYTLEAIKAKMRDEPTNWVEMQRSLKLEEAEMNHWKYIVANMYLPWDEERGVFLQQDGFLDKELKSADSIPVNQRPINQNWSWDRILRSCFIKQADVLQGLYFFEDHFDLEQIERNFDFYEPMTVHESSLSPCVHVILACKLGKMEKAYELYQRTARLDLNDFNNDTEDGLHITSMAGTWMSVVKGFGGLRVKDGNLHIQPVLPQQWKSYAFKIHFRDNAVQIRVDSEKVEISNLEGNNLEVWLNNHKFEVLKGSSVTGMLPNIPSSNRELYEIG